MNPVSYRQDSADQVLRFDVQTCPTSAVQVTHQGFLSVPATLTKTGILTYRTSDGRTVRELRRPEEVGKAESMSTFAGAPVTIDHHGLITPENVSEHEIGVVEDDLNFDGGLVSGRVRIKRQDAIEGVRNKKYVEISPGYTCQILKTPGFYEGESYDQEQINIVYNHVGIGGRGWGRSGPDVSLRMDCAISGLNLPEEKNMKKVVIRLNGISYTIEVPDELAASFIDGVELLRTERQDAISELANVQGQLASVTRERDTIQTRFDSAASTEALEKRVQERLVVIAKAKELDPEVRTDGLSSVEIQRSGLIASGFTQAELEGKSDDFIAGAFQSAKSSHHALPGITFRADQADPPNGGQSVPESSTASRERMIEYNRNLWKGENR